MRQAVRRTTRPNSCNRIQLSALRYWVIWEPPTPPAPPNPLPSPRPTPGAPAPPPVPAPLTTDQPRNAFTDFCSV